jgi:hypothetical protein
MIKSARVKLTGRKKADVIDTDVIVNWMPYSGVACCWSVDHQERKKKLM